MTLIELLQLAKDPNHNPEYLAKQVDAFINKHSNWLVAMDVNEGLTRNESMTESISAEFQMMKDRRKFYPNNMRKDDEKYARLDRDRKRRENNE